MSGIHVAYRKSKGTNFNAVESTIVLPKMCTYRPNRVVSGKYCDGVFPEFFHGFYQASTYGLDIGILYQAGGYKLFFFSYPNVVVKKTDGSRVTWYVSKQTFLPASEAMEDRTFTLKSYFANGYLVTRCLNAKGDKAASLDVFLNTAAYADMKKKGCTINREMCLAVNKNEKGTCTFPADASFSATKFTKTKMTAVDGTVVAMNLDNSITLHNKRDSGCEEAATKNCYSGGVTASVLEGSCAADVAEANLNKSE